MAAWAAATWSADRSGGQGEVAVDAGGFVSVTELDTAEGEEVEITDGEGELSEELLDGAVEVMVAPSEAEQPTNRATAAPIMSNPNGLDSPLSVMRDPLPAPRPAITRQQANALGPQIYIPASLALGCY